MLRHYHRLIGLVLLLPLLSWTLTGLIFFLKPGYENAYALLTVKTYPLAAPLSLTPHADWLEVKSLRTILGTHLLVRTVQGWQQLDAQTLQPRPAPTADEITRLLADALTQDPARYGELVGVTGNIATTSTGRRLTLDWSRLALQQRGADTDWIDRLYKIHYLQWTGIRWLDRTLGVAGLCLLFALTVLGLLLLRSSRR